jgi:putative transposase
VSRAPGPAEPAVCALPRQARRRRRSEEDQQRHRPGRRRRRLQRFADKWDARYPTISRSWLEHWEQITPFLAFPPDVRRAVYTTNTIEALNRQIRKIIKTRGQFPTEDAARKLIYLAIARAQTKWRRAYTWNSALAAFKIHFGDRIPDTAI